MTHLTPTQQKILERLPATPDQLAQALYGRATESERNLVYVHIALLRRRLSARCPTGTPAELRSGVPQKGAPQAGLNGTAAQGAHIVSTPLAPSQRDPNAEENPCPLDGLGAGSEPVEGPLLSPVLSEAEGSPKGPSKGPVEGTDLKQTATPAASSTSCSTE